MLYFFPLLFISLLKLLSTLTSDESGTIFTVRQVVTFLTGHLSKNDTGLGNEIFATFHSYVELSKHQKAFAKSSQFSSYANLSYDNSFLTALVWRLDIKE